MAFLTVDLPAIAQTRDNLRSVLNDFIENLFKQTCYK